MLHAHTPRNSLLLATAGLAIFALVSVTACTTIPKNFPPLERAQAAYAKAIATEGIKTYAPVEIYDARQMLTKAEKAEDIKKMEYLSYLAERQAQLAIAVADRKRAENETTELSKKKDTILLTTRAEEIKELQKELSALKAKRTSRGIVLTLGDVLFAFGKANLQPGAMRTIDKLAAFLSKNAGRKVLIEGHTDSIGSAEYNYMLSERRAEAVQRALVSCGISPSRIETRGYGESYPVASNNTAAGRQQNRRVEVVILNEQKAAVSTND